MSEVSATRRKEFTLQSFVWLSTAGLLGVFLAVPMRQHFVVDEKLTYPDGVATAETLMVLDARGDDAKGAARSLGGATIVSAVLYCLQFFKKLPEVLLLGPTGQLRGAFIRNPDA